MWFIFGLRQFSGSCARHTTIQLLHFSLFWTQRGTLNIKISFDKSPAVSNRVYTENRTVCYFETMNVRGVWQTIYTFDMFGCGHGRAPSQRKTIEERKEEK